MERIRTIITEEQNSTNESRMVLRSSTLICEMIFKML